MSESSSQLNRDGIMSGSSRGPAAAAARMILSAIEPFYAGAMRGRNRLYDSSIFRAVHLPAPVISIGNLTTGGTGKTPMVRWLAEWLRDEGLHPAIISRGYKSVPGELGDEQIMLDGLLNGPGQPTIPIRANPNRIAAAESALQALPHIGVFLLDDGFQHRGIARDLDIVLINALNPFGFGHVLPRGLLREPTAGLRRADAMVITRVDQVEQGRLAEIEREIRRRVQAPIYRSLHALAGFRTAAAAAARPPDRTLGQLQSRRFFAFGGIGDPRALDRQLAALGGQYAGSRWFGDHFEYQPDDLAKLQAEARGRGADLLITTEKDWAKVGRFAAPPPPEVWRLDVEIQFTADSDADRLRQQVREAIRR